MANIHKLRKTTQRLNVRKEDVRTHVPANLGLTIGGSKVVEIPTREGYHYARIRGNLNEVAQVYNVKTSPVYDLPVLISYKNNRWEVEGTDTGRYTVWGNTAYLPKHGAQHSFDPDAPGGDPVWVWGRQMMPLGAIPSGSSGGPNVLIEPSTYWQDNSWHYAGGTGTADITGYKPTGSNARMVLVYLDGDGNPQLLAGDTYFSPSLTGTSQVVSYIPAMPDTDAIGIAGVRLVSGTSTITWNNIYDLRPWIVGSGYIPTGTSGVTDHGALTGLLDNDHPQYMVTGSVASTTLTRDQIAFGSASNVVTSSPYFHITGAAGYADSYKSVFINFFGGTGSYSNYYSLNIGTDDGANNLSNVALWSFSGEPVFDMFYAGGTQDEPTTPLKDDTLSRLGFAVFSPSLGADYWYAAQIKLIAAEDFGGTDFGSYWQFINVGTGVAGNQNSLFLYPKKATFGGSIQIPSGSSTHPYPSYYLGSDVIDGSWRTTRDGDNLAFQRRESGAWVTKGYPNTGSSAGSQGEPGTPGSNTLLIYDDDTFKVTGTAIHFDTNLTVAVTGSVAYVNATGGGSGDSTYSDTVANRPSGTVNDGDLFFPSNGFTIDRVTGSSSAYQSWGPIFPLTAPPPVNTFTWLNQSSGTAVNTYGGIVLTTNASAAGLQGLYITAPSTPYTLSIAFLATGAFATAYMSFGSFFRQSSDGKLHFARIVNYSSGVYIFATKFSSPTVEVANYAFNAMPIINTSPFFLRIADNGTNRITSVSSDNLNWYAWHSIERTDYLTADQIGFGAIGVNSVSLHMTLLSWKVE